MADLLPVQHPVSALHVLAKISLPGFPDWVGIDADSGAVWISNRDRDRVERIDPATNQLVGSVPVGRSPCSGLGVGSGSLWVPNCRDRTVSRVDPGANRVVATIPVGMADSEGAIAADLGAVWMPADVNGMLARIDPARDVVVER